MNFVYKGFLLLSIFFFSTLVAIGQPGTLGAIKNDGESQGDYYYDVYANRDCETIIPMTIRLTNLIYDPILNSYVLPPGLPDMYLKYSIEGRPEVIAPLTTFVDSGDDYSGLNIYETTVYSASINVASECNSISTDNLDPNKIIRVATTLVTLESSSSGNDIYVDYPACSYSNGGGIFSCLVFHYAGDCESDDQSGSQGLIDRGEINKAANTISIINVQNNNEGNQRSPEDCYNYGLTNGTIFYRLHCPSIGCRIEDAVSDFLIDRPGDGINVELEDLFVYPNPTSTTMTIEWSAKDPIEGLALYRINGELVQSWNKELLDGTNILEVQTDLLSNGVFFLEARSSTSSKVIKVVKQ